MRTHTGEKPYKCDYPQCYYKTADKSNINRHKNTHVLKDKKRVIKSTFKA